MASVKLAYGAETAITCSLAPGGVGLANAAARESTLIDNTGNLFLDAYVTIAVKSGATAPAGQKAVNVYVWGTADTGTPTYPDPVTGTDAAITLHAAQVTLLGVIDIPAVTTTYKGQTFSVAKALGIYLPEKWGIIIENQSGGALDTTEANHKKVYQGVYATVV